MCPTSVFHRETCRKSLASAVASRRLPPIHGMIGRAICDKPLFLSIGKISPPPGRWQGLGLSLGGTEHRPREALDGVAGDVPRGRELANQQ